MPAAPLFSGSTDSTTGRLTFAFEDIIRIRRDGLTIIVDGAKGGQIVSHNLGHALETVCDQTHRSLLDGWAAWLDRDRKP